MSACLGYQSVYQRKERVVISVRTQVIGALLLLLVLSCRIWMKLESIDLGYQLADARKQTVELDMQRREFELQRSLLVRPDNLAKLARDRLKLVSLNPNQARRVNISR